MRQHIRSGGYTLVELLVVITLVAIMMYLAIVILAGVRVKATNSRAEAEISQVGGAVDIFKQVNNGFPLIVQRPYDPANSGLISEVCFSTLPQASCYPTNFIGPNGTNGFGNSLFTGSNLDSSTSYNVSILTAAGKNYGYYYMTEDCSNDTYSGVHKLSNYQDYLIVTGLTPDANGGSPDNFWIRNGNSCRGPDTAVPVLPFFSPSASTAPGITGTQTNCLTNYP